MERWEYLSVRVDWVQPRQLGIPFGQPGFRVAGAPKGTPLRALHECLDEYGADGWELVSFTPDQWRGHNQLAFRVERILAVFKRPAGR